MRRVHAVLAVLALSLGGCASSEKGPVRVPDPRTYSGENREWWDIYSVEFQGDRKVSNPVGHLYRKFDSRDPKGKYWVLDRTQESPLGFLLPDYQAFLIVPAAPGSSERKPQPVGTNDLHGGVKRILGITGTVELRSVVLPRS